MQIIRIYDMTNPPGNRLVFEGAAHKFDMQTLEQQYEGQRFIWLR